MDDHDDDPGWEDYEFVDDSDDTEFRCFSTQNQNLDAAHPGALKGAFDSYNLTLGGGQGVHQTVNFDYEHGQWWATCLLCGHQWSVVDACKDGEDYLDFESITNSDEALCDADCD